MDDRTANIAHVLDIARSLQEDLETTAPTSTPPRKPIRHDLMPPTLADGSRPYIVNTVRQLNGCFESGWYDAAALMARKLVETLIVEVFEAHDLSATIKRPNGDFLRLEELVRHLLVEKRWNIGRTSATALRHAKWLADQAAHSRRFTVHRAELERIAPDLRIITQELVFLAGFDSSDKG